MTIENLKKLAAEKVVEFVQSGMIIGLGTGSTTKYALMKIAEQLKSGELSNIRGVPSSLQTKELANQLGIPLTNFDESLFIDLTIDGADEVDENLNLIKGGGGALLREKILAQNSNEFIVVVDQSKISKKLGEKWHVPIEVIQFAKEIERKYLEEIGAQVKLRYDSEDEKFITDENNVILDSNFGIIDNPKIISEKLEKRAGIVEHGIFVNLATRVIVAKEKGIETIIRTN